jgi:hypothetical protein
VTKFDKRLSNSVTIEVTDAGWCVTVQQGKQTYTRRMIRCDGGFKGDRKGNFESDGINGVVAEELGSIGLSLMNIVEEL